MVISFGNLINGIKSCGRYRYSEYFISKLISKEISFDLESSWWNHFLLKKCLCLDFFMVVWEYLWGQIRMTLSRDTRRISLNINLGFSTCSIVWLEYTRWNTLLLKGRKQASALMKLGIFFVSNAGAKTSGFHVLYVVSSGYKSTLTWPCGLFPQPTSRIDAFTSLLPHYSLCLKVVSIFLYRFNLMKSMVWCLFRRPFSQVHPYPFLEAHKQIPYRRFFLNY